MKLRGAIFLRGRGGGGTGEAGIQYYNNTEVQLCHLFVCYYDSATLRAIFFSRGGGEGHKILKREGGGRQGSVQIFFAREGKWDAQIMHTFSFAISASYHLKFC